jgi:hypothetical protein
MTRERRDTQRYPPTVGPVGVRSVGFVAGSRPLHGQFQRGGPVTWYSRVGGPFRGDNPSRHSNRGARAGRRRGRAYFSTLDPDVSRVPASRFCRQNSPNSARNKKSPSSQENSEQWVTRFTGSWREGREKGQEVQTVCFGAAVGACLDFPSDSTAPAKSGVGVQAFVVFLGRPSFRRAPMAPSSSVLDSRRRPVAAGFCSLSGRRCSSLHRFSDGAGLRPSARPPLACVHPVASDGKLVLLHDV